MTSRRRWSALLLIASVSGCAYYNAMWSAEHFAKDARDLEAHGQDAEARSQWARAAEKAEAVVARHPKSRWADDALVLQAEGLARSGACEEAALVLARARESVKELALRERVALSDAECAVAGSHPIQADVALGLPLASGDAGRRSRAEYLAGRSAALRFDYGSAVAHFDRSREIAAGPARVRALLEAGDAAKAAAAIDGLGAEPQLETDRADLLARLAAVGGTQAASASLDRMLTRRITFLEQARLLTADGDRRLAAGEYDAAAAQYRRAILVAPVASAEAGATLVGLQRVQIARAAGRSDLAPVIESLTRLDAEPGAGAAKPLLDLVRRASVMAESPGARFRIAELARDSLNAPALAGQLFLDAAASDSASLYAPKALLAALAVLPDRRDSIAAILESRYPASPYTRAFHGEASVAYAAAEDSLARELGVQISRGVAAPLGVRVDLPVPGPRGPGLDDPESAAAAKTRARVTPARPVNRPAPARDRPVQTERP
ncbi:MAG: hypothetical protein ABR537_10260 [Gemmatimonadales bacterium]